MTIDTLEITVPTLTVEEASIVLRRAGLKISTTLLRRGIEQGVYPWADAVLMEKQYSYFIYEELMLDWLKQRAVKKEDAA